MSVLRVAINPFPSFPRSQPSSCRSEQNRVSTVALAALVLRLSSLSTVSAGPLLYATCVGACLGLTSAAPPLMVTCAEACMPSLLFPSW